MTRPRIALTWSETATRTPDWYLQAITAAGGDPVPVVASGGLAALEAADALVLAGGRDVHPARYGQAIDPRTADTLELDEARDQFELAAIAAARGNGVPILGICRGIQMLNVALGGTVLQDLALRGIDVLAHYQSRRSPAPPEWEPVHTVRLEPGSRLADLLGGAEVPVNSFHHQAVDLPAPGLRVTARSPDGLVEGVEAADAFILGVQWHPERMAGRDRRQDAIFTALVRAAQSPRLSGRR